MLTFYTMCALEPLGCNGPMSLNHRPTCRKRMAATQNTAGSERPRTFRTKRALQAQRDSRGPKKSRPAPSHVVQSSLEPRFAAFSSAPVTTLVQDIPAVSDHSYGLCAGHEHKPEETHVCSVPEPHASRPFLGKVRDVLAAQRTSSAAVVSHKGNSRPQQGQQPSGKRRKQANVITPAHACTASLRMQQYMQRGVIAYNRNLGQGSTAMPRLLPQNASASSNDQWKDEREDTLALGASVSLSNT